MPLDIYRIGHSIMQCGIFAKFMKFSSDDLVIFIK